MHQEPCMHAQVAFTQIVHDLVNYNIYSQFHLPSIALLALQIVAKMDDTSLSCLYRPHACMLLPSIKTVVKNKWEG